MICSTFRLSADEFLDSLNLFSVLRKNWEYRIFFAVYPLGLRSWRGVNNSNLLRKQYNTNAG